MLLLDRLLISLHTYINICNELIVQNIKAAVKSPTHLRQTFNNLQPYIDAQRMKFYTFAAVLVLRSVNYAGAETYYNEEEFMVSKN